jgi:hypothetical protein
MERKMKKILIIIATMMSLSIHSQEGRYAMHAFYFIDVSNPVAVVGALDEFAASECGKKLPADIGLMAEGINGSASSTHFIIVSYETMDDFTKAGALTQSCPEAAKMLQGLASGSEAISEVGIIPAIEVGDWTQDTVFMKYDISTSNEAANEASHFVYIGAQDFATLVDNQNAMTSSSAFAKFSKKVGMVREVLNTSLILPVKSWPKQ